MCVCVCVCRRFCKGEGRAGACEGRGYGNSDRHDKIRRQKVEDMAVGAWLGRLSTDDLLLLACMLEPESVWKQRDTEEERVVPLR